jgi:hypothetical protein
MAISDVGSSSCFRERASRTSKNVDIKQYGNEEVPPSSPTSEFAVVLNIFELSLLDLENTA